MSEIDNTVLQDNQLAVATVEQTGTIISGTSATDSTCLVQTEDGVQRCVKTYPLNGGGGGSYTLPTATANTLGGIKVGDNLTVEADGTLNAQAGGGGTSDYTDLSNKPSINSVTLSGDKTGADLGLLENKATGTGSIQIGGTNANQYSFVTLIGERANATAASCIAISNGNSNAVATAGSIAMGNAQCLASNTIVISPSNFASAFAVGAIQLGGGTNTTANTFQVFSYQLLDGTTGLIPLERLGTGYDATKTQVLKHINGVATWVDEN